MDDDRIGAPTLQEQVRDIAETHAGERGPLLPVLHDIQHQIGWIDPDAVPVVADVLNLSRAEVHGVVTFYTDFRSTPPPRVTVQLCRAEACQANGCEGIVDHARRRFGIEVGDQTEDGTVGLDEVFCLGLCGVGPAARVGERVLARLDRSALDAAVDAALEARP